MKKAVLSVLLSLTILATVGVPALAAGSSPTFTDVIDSDWYVGDVAYAYNQNLMKGTSDTLFTPDGSATRGMLVSILYRLEGSPAASGAMPFADVARGSYYYNAVGWSAANGIVRGYSASTFAPNAVLTREQFAVILCRYAAFKGLDVSARGNLSTFSDASSVSAYAQASVSWANAEKLLQGSAGAALNPGGNATRAQTAAILHRFCVGVLKRSAAGTAAFVPCESAPNIFSKISQDFYCNSNGRSGTVLSVSTDGSFKGYYVGQNFEDSVYGLIQVKRECNFSGYFTRPRKINSYTYAFDMVGLTYANPVNTKTNVTKDGYTLYTDAYGVTGGKTFLLYDKGAPTSELPESFISWATKEQDWGWNNTPSVLPCFGLYNVITEDGFTTED